MEQAGNLRSKVFEKVDVQKDQLVSGLDQLAKHIDDAGKEMAGPEAKLASRAAGFLRSAEGMIKERRSDELFDRAVTGIREHPAALISGAFVMGFLGARLLRS